ncbi:hypothetical protein [Echinicola shivajiensis]|uniref:hypothetical protein n=1 Tax=Echinicola shivajiensis TaxID=1035916 RepID=UPI001BFC5DB8|nr:hypothetical protein [Echinicola shivajiensis]
MQGVNPGHQGLFENLLNNFHTVTKRSPSTSEEKEILELSQLLVSPEQAIVAPQITHYHLIQSTMDTTCMEFGMSDLSSKKERWAGIFCFENKYILVSSPSSIEKSSLEIQILGSDISAIPLIISYKTKDGFWLEFEWLYHFTFDS